MSEIFSIQISKHGTDRHVWLDLPATAEQVQAAMGQIGITQDNPWDYTVSGFSVPEDRHMAIPWPGREAADRGTGSDRLRL